MKSLSTLAETVIFQNFSTTFQQAKNWRIVFNNTVSSNFFVTLRKSFLSKKLPWHGFLAFCKVFIFQIWRHISLLWPSPYYFSLNSLDCFTFLIISVWTRRNGIDLFSISIYILSIKPSSLEQTYRAFHLKSENFKWL